MTQRMASCILISAIIMGVGSQVMLHTIDKATAKQCQAHDWPKAADSIHKEWCVTHGYKI
jgi:hypothetical protein